MWSTVLTTTVAKLRDTSCDFCFLCAPLAEVHRSLCKTKNYCSKNCRDADDQAHKVCCKKGNQTERRKVKIGGKKKAEAADANLRRLVSRRLAPNPPPTDKDSYQCVLFEKKLIEKLQLKEARRLNKLQAQEISEVD